MLFRHTLLERYLIKTVIPYLLLSFFILTGLLLLQESGKFAEILSFSREPFLLTLEITLGVVPGVVLFTLPMSVLVGTATGFARMGSDSELVALRAAGVSHLRLTVPILIFGALISTFALLDGFIFAPKAAQSLRQVLYRATLDKLESPIQPHTFNTQMAGKVVYVRDGDQSLGEWERVFISWQDPGGELRLITARKGRLDTGGEQTELVLSDAIVTTIPTADSTSPERLVTEHSDQLRLKINDGRAALADQLEREPDEEELGFSGLINKTSKGSWKERRDATSSLHRRLALGLTALPFALLGIGLGGRARRGGRAFGAVLSLFAMVIYYLIFLGGDYLIRAGSINPLIGNWAAATLTLLIGLSLIFFSDTPALTFRGIRQTKIAVRPTSGARRASRMPRLSLLGLLDRSILTSLFLYFSLSLAILVGVFLIFTFFETLRLAAARGTQPGLIPPYLFYLIPFASMAVLPIATLLSILTTYALMARRNEAVSWWSTGQSFYRLALPSLFFSLVICGASYGVQERILPEANQRQNYLRSRIRGEPLRTGTPSGFQWLVVSDQQIYSYAYREGEESLDSPTLYQFDNEGVHLKEVVRGKVGHSTVSGSLMLVEASVIRGLDSPSASKLHFESRVEPDTPFYIFKPSHKDVNELRTMELKERLNRLSATILVAQGGQANTLFVALWRRKVEPFYSLVMWINALPLAFSFGRNSVVRPLFIAVFLGLGFWLGNAVLTQAGIYGLTSPILTALGLPIILSTVGIHLFSKART
jgi:LPS export ABC transporter permease LptF